MKRTALIVLAAFTLGALAVPAAAAHSKEFKVIQNAVKQEPASASERGHRHQARSLRVLIKDDGGEGVEISLSLPIPVIELVLAGSDSPHFKIDDEHGEIDLKACWKALKRAGPRAMVEIRGDGALFRLWLD
jgi:hypothetical protein